MLENSPQVTDVEHVENLLKELGLSTCAAPRLYCDNTGATYLCANPIYHSRMKHVALDYHFVREKVVIDNHSINLWMLLPNLYLELLFCVYDP